MKTIIRPMPGAGAACGVLLLGLILHGVALRAQVPSDPLAAAKDRYATAEYEGALALLDGLKPAESDTALRSEIEKYRALCYLALRNTTEADTAIERFVKLDPEFDVDKLDASTWVRDRFHQVRRRVLQDIVTKRYEAAKGDVQAKSYQQAAPQLKSVLRLLEDPDLATSDARWRNDLRTLTQGWLDLADAAPPPAPPAPKETEVPKPVSPPVTAAVIPPVAIRETVPPWPPEFTTRGVIPREGRIEISVDEKGTVTAAVILVSVYPFYDEMLRQAALKWQYKPATKGGVPVPYKFTRRIVVKPGGSVGGQVL
jgi:TonB family protein